MASPLFQYDKISTSRKSRAAFTLDDLSQVILSSGSTISIDKNIYDPGKRFRQILFRMSKGAARFVVSKSMTKGSSFIVITLNGVAEVRGTELVTLVDPNEETRFVSWKVKSKPPLVFQMGNGGPDHLFVPEKCNRCSKMGSSPK
mgnify:CR=1 FL=1